MKITEYGLLDKLYQRWRDNKLKGAAKKLLDKDPELKKSFQNMNSASENAIAALVKKFPHLKDEFGK